MHRLNRQIRFSINPFAAVRTGCNSYASKPCGSGLSFYLALWVELSGKLDPETGFIVNVSRIDQAVRDRVIPLFDTAIRDASGQRQPVSLTDLCGVLRIAWPQIQDVFLMLKLERLALELNPYRTFQLTAEDSDVIQFSEKFEFAAMHRLWNAAYDASKNVDLFGKCANPAGHGHNYILEVTVEKNAQPEPDDWIAGFEKVVEESCLWVVGGKKP